VRAAGWIALVLAVGVLGAALGAGRIATVLVNAPANRAWVLALAEEVLGRDVEVSVFAVGVFPPVLGAAEVRVAGATRGAPAVLEARRVELRVALVPLVAGAVVIDSLVIDEPLVRLVRTDRGLELPVPAGADGAGLAERVDRGGSSVAVRSVAARDGRIHFEDRTLSPPRSREVGGVDFSLRGHSPDAPSEFDLSVKPEAGGQFQARGTASPSGALELEGEFRNFPLESIAPYLSFASELGGGVSGTVRHRGPALAPERWAGDLQLDDAHVRVGEFELAGPLVVHFEVSRPFGDADGRFEIDATGADVRLGGVYAKPPGRPADLTGRFVSVEGRLGVDDLHLRIREPVAGRPDSGWQVASRSPTSWRTGESDGFERQDQR